jgi:hypothetical protein
MVTLPSPFNWREQAYCDTVTEVQTGSPAGRRGSSAVITDAQTGSSADMTSRIRRYTITMGFRTACFVSMIFVEGPFRWVLFAGAVFLPYVAVLFANQANRRTTKDQVTRAEPMDRPQLSSAAPIEIVSGSIVDDDPVAGSTARRDDPRREDPRREDLGGAGRDRRVA